MSRHSGRPSTATVLTAHRRRGHTLNRAGFYLHEDTPAKDPAVLKGHSP